MGKPLVAASTVVKPVMLPLNPAVPVLELRILSALTPFIFHGDGQRPIDERIDRIGQVSVLAPAAAPTACRLSPAWSELVTPSSVGDGSWR